jgi:hypothetical protein
MTTFIVVESITPQVAVALSTDQGPQGIAGVTGLQVQQDLLVHQ